MKQKFKKFFTLDHRKSDGFTLVELIVVIAIMAILAGAGTVAYGAYVKHSNKKADQILVGEVVRAIKTGNNSLVYKLSESLQASERGAQIPVGFIVLTENGSTTMESSSTQSVVGTNVACQLSEVTVYRKTNVGNDSYKDGCNTRTEAGVCTLEAVETITACMTHSPAKQSCSVWNSGVTSDTDPEAKQFTKGEYYLEGTNLASGSDHVQGQIKSDEVYGSYYDAAKDSEGNYVTANNSGMLYDSLKAAFGTKDLSLKYDGWTVSSIPTFWNDATDTWENIQKLSEMMYDLTQMEFLGANVGSLIAEKMSIGSYDSAADIVHSVSSLVDRTFADKEAFVAQWATYGNAEGDLSGGDNFGIDNIANPGRENYSALRAAYNNCFASYVRKHHSGSTETVEAHAKGLSEYGELGSDMVSEKLGSDAAGGLVSLIAKDMADSRFPRQLCAASFTSGDQSWLGNAAGCTECANLYTQYIETNADDADAAAVYDTLMTAAGADSNILNGNLYDDKGNEVDFFDYYGNYIAEFEGMYSAATNLAANGESVIVISVFYQDNEIQCDVSPLEANPRSK